MTASGSEDCTHVTLHVAKHITPSVTHFRTPWVSSPYRLHKKCYIDRVFKCEPYFQKADFVTPTRDFLEF